MKILTVVGARPQFIKAAVVSRLLRNKAKEIIVHTGQHYDYNMSDIFFKELQIPDPDYNLGISGGSHGSMTGKMLSSIEEVLMSEKPDKLLVYGDTNSTMAAAIAAVKLHIPVYHVEAGNRFGTLDSPEEVNRIVGTGGFGRWVRRRGRAHGRREAPQVIEGSDNRQQFLNLSAAPVPAGGSVDGPPARPLLDVHRRLFV